MVAGDEAAALSAGAEPRRPDRLRHDQAGARPGPARAGCRPGPTADVRLNLVAPGPVQTPLLQGTLDDPVLGPLVELLPVPLGRAAEPAEIAGPIAFLLSSEAAMIHGSVLFVDGGSDALFRSDHV